VCIDAPGTKGLLGSVSSTFTGGPAIGSLDPAANNEGPCIVAPSCSGKTSQKLGYGEKGKSINFTHINFLGFSFIIKPLCDILACAAYYECSGYNAVPVMKKCDGTTLFNVDSGTCTTNGKCEPTPSTPCITCQQYDEGDIEYTLQGTKWSCKKSV
jgi:hypothetical protein